jgi:hypothetical protein
MAGTIDRGYGIGTWAGFSGITTAPMTLYVSMSVDYESSQGASVGGTGNVDVSLDGGTTLTNIYSGAAGGTFTLAIPTGQDLSKVMVRVATAITYSDSDIRTVDITVTDIHIA